MSDDNNMDSPDTGDGMSLLVRMGKQRSWATKWRDGVTLVKKVIAFLVMLAALVALFMGNV